jgi:hypothetical protein
VFYLLALAMILYKATERPDRAWYQARAGAESFKSLAWRYAVGGAPFSVEGLSGPDADRRFEEQLTRVFDALPGLPSPLLEHGEAVQITPRMRELRAQPLDLRKDAYRRGRVEDQERWYSLKSGTNERVARRWNALALVVTFAGLIAGVVRIVTDYDFDLLGLAAVAAASITAWTENRQHRSLAVAYADAAQALAAISLRFPHIVDDAGWTAFVDEAEQTMTRERNSWLTRRDADL